MAKKKTEAPEQNGVSAELNSLDTNSEEQQKEITKETIADFPFVKEWETPPGLSELQNVSSLITGNVLVTEAKASSIQAEVDSGGSPSEKILNFLKSRNSGSFVRLNDFLKSLYPMPKNNEPFEWQQQTKMKTLRAIINGMVVNRQIATSTNSYMQLGKSYWPDDSTGKTHYHHLGSLVIEAKLL